VTAFLKLLGMVVAIALQDGFRYFLFAGIAWLLGYVLFRKRWAARKINPEFPARRDMWRELRLSLVTLLIYGVVGAATLWAFFRGWTQLYLDLGAHSTTWFWASITLTIVLHDTYFYWTHRLMHWPRIFAWTHRGHHLSINPSPWAAYAFDPVEAFIQAGIFPLAVCLYPMHPVAFLIFMVWQITFNVIGHTGYEIWPRWLMDSWLGKFLNTPTNHVMHHEHFRGNYGIYFNVWDRLMGTNHERYEARFREVTSRA
jgi:sterol desaturase/sphingolipid hydroxylase (fatty acid hydroxylase superfamily)